MRTSEAGRDFIARHEGVVLRAYRDVAGVMTIGIGHTARAGAPVPADGMTITREEALDILGRDLARFEKRVATTGAFPAQRAFDGAVSFDFNTGRIHNASWVGHYRAGLFARAEGSLMKWVKAGGRTWPGLKRRRQAEADLVFRGRYEEGGPRVGGRATEPAVSTRREEVAAYQRQLKALGFYKGAVDGIAGPKTLAAVRDFQRAHPHLSEDGIVGPATRAALDRATNAIKAAANTGGGAIAGGSGAGAAVDGLRDGGAGWADPWMLGAGVGLAVLALVGAWVAWRYRDEIRLFAARL